jgi:hypothetical protein
MSELFTHQNSVGQSATEYVPKRANPGANSKTCALVYRLADQTCGGSRHAMRKLRVLELPLASRGSNAVVGNANANGREDGSECEAGGERGDGTIEPVGGDAAED